MARPRKQVDVVEVLRLRLEGQSWPVIARRMRLGLGTVYRAYRHAIEALKPFQNASSVRLQADGHRDLRRADNRRSVTEAGMISRRPPEERISAGIE
jgi:hypothetical protein